ncbi:nuclear transport factor 2 family protein [Streptomyces sp. JL1001]|uniref:Nuclear transport factor 2 family protein n=1 Tax=Streptomyces sp. JL1001 TaxID=3078227 RepID=A0AAU8KQ59_9ACTN|nr:nuclear transport factor 2 family protein [Streptomyces sp. Termitarium-T10T-6]SCE07271.1 SnoaL-like domain-containing protein [Streptomyces sp. Termitarium-T10T-6]
MDTTDALGARDRRDRPELLGRPDLLEPVGRLIAERACERLIVEFVQTLDLGEPGDVAELFTPDGVWEWVDGHTGGMLPPRLPVQVGRYEDTFREIEGRWLLTARELFLDFAGPTERLSPADARAGA